MATKAAQEFIPRGIFDGRTPLKPEFVRSWLFVVRTALNWSVAEAAKHSGVSAQAIATLEMTGLPLTEEADTDLRDLAYTYQRQLPEDLRLPCRPGLTHIAERIRDADFATARRFRGRASALGLSVEQIAKRCSKHFSAAALERAMWNGSLEDDNSGLRVLARVLRLPFLEIQLWLERGWISEADVDEWIAWRDAQKVGARRKGRAA